MHDVMIRDRQPADLPRCLAVLAAVHSLDHYPQNWPDDPPGWLAPSNALHAWVAEIEPGRVAGHIAVRRCPSGEAGPTNMVEVSRLFVDPAARRRNVASRLLHHARQRATEHRFDLTLEVVEEHSSAAAISLYERTGWQHTTMSTATWRTPEGRPVRLRRYAASDGTPGT